MLEVASKRMIEIDGGGAIIRLGSTMAVSQITDQSWHHGATDGDKLYLLSGDEKGVMLERFDYATGRIEAQVVAGSEQVSIDIGPHDNPMRMIRRLKPSLDSTREKLSRSIAG